jgi:hypothetical protein
VSEKRWRAGESVIHRYVGHGDGVLWGWPHIVVSDSPELTILYQPEGTPILLWSMDEGRFLEPLTARMDALRFIYPELPYHVTLFFDGGSGVPPWFQPHFGSGEGRFRGWKVDMSAPHRRTELGFDTTDDVLDYIVRPDGSWYVKDEPDLVRYMESGVYTQAEADRIREHCGSIAPLIEGKISPFDDEWVDWRAPAGMSAPKTPDGWQLLPGADIHLSTLNYEQGLPGRPYDAWRKRP